ncbi:putative quinol monooxygenase [Stackebrandtia endophytica]|nr:putative quinol monooxygenase [Stackebrandtia endophytica]
MNGPNRPDSPQSSRQWNMGPVIIVHATVTAQPPFRDQLENLLRRLRDQTRAADPGCLEYTYYRDIDDDCRFICVEVWKDEASLRAHLAAPHMNDPNSRFAEFTQGEERVEIWRSSPIPVEEFE